MNKKCVICENYFTAPDTYRGRKKQTCSNSCARKLGAINNVTTKECLVCGRKTETTKSNLFPYCSNCVDSKQKYEYTCLVCSKKGRTNHYGTKLCSTECINIYNSSKQVDLKCKYCGKNFSRPSFTVIKNKTESVYCSKKCRDNQYSLDNPTRYGGTWSRRAKEVKNRDKNKCLLCGETENLQVHHFKKIKLFENPDDAHFEDNLGTFCVKCHKKIEGKYLSLSEFLKDIV